MKHLNFLGTAAVALAMGWGGAAQANLIDLADAATTEVVVNASCTNTVGCNGSTPSSTVSAQAILSGFAFTGPSNNATLTFNVALTNTTQQGTLSTATFQGIQLTGFAFNTSPDGSSVTGGDSIFHITTENNFPGFNTVDICASTGNNANNCAGGSNNGITPGQTDNFSVSIAGLNSVTGIDLGTDVNGGAETYDFKIAGSIGSFEFSGPGTECTPGTPGCVVNPPTNVPEPTSLVVFGSALIGFGAMRRKRARKGRQALAA